MRIMQRKLAIPEPRRSIVPGAGVLTGSRGAGVHTVSIGCTNLLSGTTGTGGTGLGGGLTVPPGGGDVIS